MGDNKYLVIVPARAGSKGVVGKNTIDVNGKPLIVYTLEVALAICNIRSDTALYVSTDDEKVVSVCREHHVDVPSLRPELLSSDQAKTVDVVIHVLHEEMEKGKKWENVILLQPTSPLRNVDDVNTSIRIFEETGEKSLISAYLDPHLNEMIMYKKRLHAAVPLNPNHNTGTRRQESESIYIRNGAIYIVNTDYLLTHMSLIADSPSLYVMPENRSINVDTYDDLQLLRGML